MGKPKPIKRNNTSFDLGTCCVLAVVFSILAYWTNTNILRLSIDLVLVCPALLLFKLFLFIRESVMWGKAYSSTSDLVLKCIKMTNWQSFLLLESATLCFFVYGIIFGTTKTEIIVNILKEDGLIIVFICFLVMYCQWNESPITESYRLEKSYSFSGGSAMALGFHYGYLKLIMKGFLKKLNDFQGRNKLEDSLIPFKKLFILIPSSTFIFDQLRQTGAEQLEPLEDRLEAHKQDRGMVEKRAYKNTVYKLKKKNSSEVECYIPLEGATPIKTYWEACVGESRFKEFKKEVISSFYYTLDELVNKDRETRGLIELVYYNDEKNPDIDLAKVVRKRIKYLKGLKEGKQ